MKKISALAIAGVFTASLAATAFAEMAEVKVGGEIRVRDVIKNNYDWDDDLGDRMNTVTQRTRVNVDAKLDETTKAFIQLQDTRTWGSETTTFSTGAETTESSVDLAQGYVQLDKLFDQPLSLKLGRQILAYGEHRLVGSFEWSDNARKFDALKLMYNTDAFSVDFWTAKVLEAGTNEEDGYFNGLYATVKTIPANSLDLYVLQVQDATAGADDNFLTYGARLDGKAMNIDWTLEGAIQSGDAAEDVDQEASMIAARAGYTIPNTPSIRIGGEFVTASGDDGTDADKNEGWNDLYPTNHPLYGVSDVTETKLSGVGAGTGTGSGLTAWSINASAKPLAGLKLLAEYWNFEATEDDATGGEDAIGTEINIQAWYKVRENVNLHAYYARFTPDDALTGGGSDDEADNVTLQMEVKF